MCGGKKFKRSSPGNKFENCDAVYSLLLTTSATTIQKG